MLDSYSLRRPGLFVTATDTGVGKTAVTAAIALLLRRQRPAWKVGVCKPFATGCRREREGLVNADAEALAHFADCREPLDVINPLRFKPPLAPAVAAEQAGAAVDWPALGSSLDRLDRGHDVMLIEGVGGLLVPLDPADPGASVLSLMQAVGYPALVVTRPGLGTLNHTAMTVRLLREAGVPIAGLVINRYPPDVATGDNSSAGAAASNQRAAAACVETEAVDDPSVASNRQWLPRVTGAPVRALVPAVGRDQCAPERGVLGQDILAAMAMQRWDALLQHARQA